VSPRRFPFGREIPRSPPRPAPVHRTAPLDGFVPPERVLPFPSRKLVVYATLPLDPPATMDVTPPPDATPPRAARRRATLWLAVALLVLALDAALAWALVARP
jgi:hypothetical protein